VPGTVLVDEPAALRLLTLRRKPRERKSRPLRPHKGEELGAVNGFPGTRCLPVWLLHSGSDYGCGRLLRPPNPSVEEIRNAVSGISGRWWCITSISSRLRVELRNCGKRREVRDADEKNETV